jgi:hypothetical protein
MDEASQKLETSAAPAASAHRGSRPAWLYPLLRIVLIAAIGYLAWYVAGHWNRWTGAARFESTDDAYVAGRRHRGAGVGMVFEGPTQLLRLNAGS